VSCAVARRFFMPLHFILICFVGVFYRLAFLASYLDKSPAGLYIPFV